MRGNSNIGVWVFLATIGLAIALLFLFSDTFVDWDSKYSLKDEHPYGISFIHDLLEERAGKGNFEFMEDSFDEVYRDLDSTENYTYMYLGFGRDYDSLELISILDFVRKGNSFMVSTEYAVSNLLDTLLTNRCRSWQRHYYYHRNSTSYADSIAARFSDSLEQAVQDVLKEEDIEFEFDQEDDQGDWLNEDSTSYYVRTDSVYQIDSSDTSGYWYSNYIDYAFQPIFYGNFEQPAFCKDSGYAFVSYDEEDTSSRHWSYFNRDCINDNEDKVEILGHTIDSYINSIRIPFGEGFFYFHSSPIFFTNVELLEDHGLDYAEKYFSYFTEDIVLWDAYEEETDYNYDWNVNNEDSPLSYILSEPALKWSLYLMLLGGFLYIVFRAKRRQQLIPVIEPNSNTSLEYVEMMGQLYFEQKDHRYIARQLYQQFMDYIRSHYYLTAAELKGDWVTKLSIKSNIAKSKITGIERAYARAGLHGCTEDDLANLYDKLKYFYSNCK